MEYRIIHKTRYVYSESVSLCHNEVRLIPRNLPFQTVIARRVNVEPKPSAFGERDDFFGNRVCYFSIEKPHKELLVSVTSQVRVTPAAVPDPELSLPWEEAKKRIAADRELADDCQFSLDSPLIASGKALQDYALPSFSPQRPLMAAARDLMCRIHRDFEFRPGFTSVSTPLDEVLKHRRGVCQDFAHVAVGAIRSMGLAARYVSGYLETLPPPGQERLQGADVSHAWFSVCVPDYGWLDFDPTNDIIPGEQHIITAWGRDYSDVTPLKGVIFGSGSHNLIVSVDVERRG
ncbi:MAG: transglutaminase family protein [Desulfococcaceae bacterium]|jgi:transglutaminase-like putative cysteine protease|nr:transglutaminase family protein [Desulfococcaceae bacterium]